MIAAFEDHLRGIPETGVPYAPAWDGDKDHCVAWMAYRPECDLLFAKINETEFELLRSDAVGKPAVAQTRAGLCQVAAPVCEGENWSCRRFLVSAEGFEELTPLADPGGFIESVRLLAAHDGNVLAAITREEDSGSCIILLRAGENNCEEILRTPSNLSAYRPVPVFMQSEPGIVFDAWDGQAYRIYLQTASALITLSDKKDNRWQLAPDAAIGNDGALYAAWIRDTDVISLQGVADARCELLAARITSQEDGIQVEPFGAVDDLSHGLMDTCPDPQAVWGYCGRRRHPMILLCNDGVRILWEQKEIHKGPTRDNLGVLWSRQLDSSGAGDAVALAEGGLHYEIPGSHRSAGVPEVACYEGIFTDERCIVFKELSLQGLDKSRLRLESWRGWKPVTLPLPEMKLPERPVMEVDGKTYSLYWLDLHCHTALSGDAEGEVDVSYRTARHKALLDGVLMTDNDHYVVPLNHNEWRTNCEMADAFDAPGEFAALIGYEWTCRRYIEGQQEVDHRSVLLPGPTRDIVRWNEAEGGLNVLYEFVRAEGGFTHAHHQYWHLIGDPLEVNIEAASSWDPYLEHDPEAYNAALRAGHRIGVIGGSDEHRRNPGLGGALTGVWAESLSRESILEALRCRRCLATSGHRVVVDFRVNGQPMGQTVQATEANIFIQITAPVGIQSVNLIRDGEVLREWTVDGEKNFSAELTDQPSPGNHFYYLRIQMEGEVLFLDELPSNLQQLLGPLAWTSPVWMEA